MGSNGMNSHIREERFAELLALPAGWDSYGARKIDPLAIAAARRLLDALPKYIPEPAIAPMSNGGVELEWTRDQWNELAGIIDFHPPDSSPRVK